MNLFKRKHKNWFICSNIECQAKWIGKPRYFDKNGYPICPYCANSKSNVRIMVKKNGEKVYQEIK